MISRREKDLLTPHKISVVLLIEKYGGLRPKLWGSETGNETSFLLSRNVNLSPKERKATCVLVSKLIQGSDLSLAEFIELIQRSRISRSHINLFTAGLQELYKNGIEGLLTLFDAVEKFCTQDQSRSENFPCLWTTSLVGLHLRQLNLGFRRLGFSHVISLYQKFCSYYELCYQNRPSILEEPSSYKTSNAPLSTSDNQENERIDDQDMDIDISGSSKDCLDTVSPAPAQKEEENGPLCMSFPPIHRSSSRTISVGNRQQAELFVQEQITLLLQQDPTAMSPSQLQEAISTMLRNCPDLGRAHFLSYLNCLRVREQTGAIHSLVRAYDSKLIHKEAGREDVTRTFRYAALNMAALQAQFGHRELGLISLEEAIRLAQESNDHICLQYALAWLYTLSPFQKALLMKRSLKRSSEMNLAYLSWLSLLNYAKELSKSKISPAKLLKLLGPGNQCSSNQSRNPNTLEGGLYGQSGLWGVQTGLWSLWGNLHLTAICSQLVLRISPQTSGSIHAPSTISPSCSALCNMALVLASLGEFTLSGELLQHAQQWYPSPLEHAKLWMITKNYINFYELLRQGLWSQAKSVAINLATVHPTYSKLLETELFINKGEYSRALKLIESLQVNCADENQCEEPNITVKILLMESEALAGGNNLGGALATLVKCIRHAQEHHMAYLEALGQLHMASVQMHLGLLKEAHSSLQKGLDVILASGGIYDQARAKLLQAKIEVRSSNKNDNYSKLMSAAQMLEEAQKMFTLSKAYNRVKETVYLKARFYHECGNLEGRNRSALEFRQLEHQHPSQPVVANTCVF